MKKFRFKLQTLLDQRKSKEDALLAELGDLRREEAEEMMRLAHLQAQLDNAISEIAKALGRNAHPGEITRWDTYAKATRDDIKVQELTIDVIRARVEEKRTEVVDAMKDRQVLEALRDKQEHAYIMEQERKEQNSLDEIASVRYARGM